MTRFSRDEILHKVKSVPFWWHSLKLGEDVVTPGNKTPDLLANELSSLRLPDLQGKTVLDIGAWDGYYSFEAERRGAASVTALDHYVWSMDLPAMMAYWSDCKAKGTVPKQYDEVPGMWRPDELPGKRGFDVAHEVLGSKVKSVVADFMSADIGTIGRFDVVFYFGVLYHMHDPFRSLKRLANVTRQMAIIETAAMYVPGYANSSLWEFYESNELNGDVNNWWAPSEVGLVGMCRAAGFSRVKVLTPNPARAEGIARLADFARSALRLGHPSPIPYRLVAHAWK